MNASNAPLQACSQIYESQAQALEFNWENPLALPQPIEIRYHYKAAITLNLYMDANEVLISITAAA